MMAADKPACSAQTARWIEAVDFDDPPFIPITETTFTVCDPTYGPVA